MCVDLVFFGVDTCLNHSFPLAVYTEWERWHIGSSLQPQLRLVKQAQWDAGIRKHSGRRSIRSQPGYCAWVSDGHKYEECIVVCDEIQWSSRQPVSVIFRACWCAASPKCALAVCDVNRRSSTAKEMLRYMRVTEQNLTSRVQARLSTSVDRPPQMLANVARWSRQ